MDDSRVFFNRNHETECKSCGGVKQLRHAFCKPCYFRLPEVLHAGLFKPTAGYPNHFRVCLNWLRENEHGKAV